ncbi:Cation efflux family [Fragilaria crotonensis]|nr:Cation efflux family [Fragilaria crotonensis]
MVSSDADAANRIDVVRRLYTATLLCSCFLIVEVVGGYLSGSLAVLSDAAHLFADLASFAIAIVAAHLASLPTTDQHTFGLKRSESLAALISMLSLALVSIWLAVEAIRRLYIHDAAVDGRIMSGVAAIGVFVNIVLALVLGVEHHVHLPGADHGHSHDHGCDGHDRAVGHHDEHGTDHKCDGHDHHTDHGHDHKHREHDHHDCEHGHDHHDHKHGHNHSSTATHDHHSKEDDHGHSCKGHDHHDHHDHHETHTGKHKSDHEHSHDHTSTETTKLISEHSRGQYESLHLDEVRPEKAPRNVNLHAAYLHVMGDLAQSVGVLIAGVVIWYRPDWRIIDPICTLFFCSIVFYSTLGVLRSSISVLLEEVPPNIKWRDVYDAIQGVEGVENVHDLHIWSISHGHPTLTVHCSTMNDPQSVLVELYSVIKKQGIEHATIQVQANGEECVTCVGNTSCDEKRCTTEPPV